MQDGFKENINVFELNHEAGVEIQGLGKKSLVTRSQERFKNLRELLIGKWSYA